MSVLQLIPSSDRRSDVDLLHEISVALLGEHDSAALYGKIVDAAIAITQAQFGTMQLRQQSSKNAEVGLHLLSSRGLTPEDEAFWKWVGPAAHSSCMAALRSGKRAVIPDFEAWDEIAGTDDLLAFRRAGIRSAQTTPLVSRDGTLLGMISTHWSEPHQPSQRDLRLLDILARQAADILERTVAEEALHAREKELEAAIVSLNETQQLRTILAGELGHRVKNLFAMVTAITAQTMRNSSDQARVHTLQQRFLALSSASDLLLQSNWKAASLSDVVAAATRNAGVSDRVQVGGPIISIGSKAALSVSLLLHELATNALKHGSLSVGGGVVELSWRIDATGQGDVLRLTWRETKGPEVEAPKQSGFGSKLISAGLVGSGGVVLAYNRSGLVCEISAPLDELQSAS